MIKRFLTRFFKRSIAGRMMLYFVIGGGLIWSIFVAWLVYSAMTLGSQEATEGMSEVGSQIMVVVSEYPDDPEKLARAIRRVEQIANEPEPGEEFDPDDVEFIVQFWQNGKIYQTNKNLPEAVPDIDTGLQKFSVDGKEWIAYVLSDHASKAKLRIALPNENLAIKAGDLAFMFFPLIISLPILLVPAWLMTRRGLKPLGQVVADIGARVETGRLEPLPKTPYGELNQVVRSVNQLMARLDTQMQRDREFVADVAHELKTPLAILKTNAGIVQTTSNQQTRERALRDLDAGLDRSTRLIHQMLRMARLGQDHDKNLQPERRLDIAEFLRERIGTLIGLADKRGITFELDAPEAAMRNIDADSFGAILDNLLDNAAKHSPDNGVISTQLIVSADQSIVLSVQDQGPGIAPELRQTVFKRFKRFEHSNDQLNVGSAGLGLAIVQRATERLGGVIELSAPSSGTGLIATLTLPAPEPEVE